MRMALVETMGHRSGTPELQFDGSEILSEPVEVGFIYPVMYRFLVEYMIVWWGRIEALPTGCRIQQVLYLI